MSKISGRNGHTDKSTGASAKLNEVVEARKINNKVFALLSQFNEMISSQPLESTPYPAELIYGIKIANDNKVDLAYSIHLNKAFNEYNGALGSEVLVNLNNPQTVAIGSRILNNMQKAGFKNRGLKDGSRFGEINSINGNSCIIEVCFVEATSDVALYQKLGVDKVARLIANGIDPRVSINEEKEIIIMPIQQPKPTISYVGHVQNKGWIPSVKDGETCGTTEQGLRLEALSAVYLGSGVLKSSAHIQNYGWTNERMNGEVLGTTSMGLRLEAVKFRLEGAEANIHIEYRTHIQNEGWKDWARDGEVSGSVGKSLRIEAIEIRIVVE